MALLHSANGGIAIGVMITLNDKCDHQYRTIGMSDNWCDHHTTLVQFLNRYNVYTPCHVIGSKDGTQPIKYSCRFISSPIKELHGHPLLQSTPTAGSAEYVTPIIQLQSTEHPSPSNRSIHNISNGIVIIVGLAGHQGHAHSPRGSGVRVMVVSGRI